MVGKRCESKIKNKNLNPNTFGKKKFTEKFKIEKYKT
jgi:hypothetical protein